MGRRQRKKTPEGNFTATIDAQSHDGRGIAHIDGKTTFIFNALPGEQVEFHYTECRSKYDEGHATAITIASPDRVIPKCAHFGVCGGCNLQHLSSQAQLTLKQKSLLEQLQHFGRLTPQEVLPPLTGPEWGYRHKARLGVRYVIKKNALLVGFRERQSKYLAQLEQCEILNPKVGYLIMALRALIQQMQAYRDIAQIEVAIGDDVPALIFRNLIELEQTDLDLLSAFGEQHKLWIYLQPGNASTVTKFYPNDGELFLNYSLPEFNLRYHYHPLDFTQVNPIINQKMLRLALDLLNIQSSDTVLDLYCGLGNFSLPMAQLAKEVVAIEGSELMVERAKMNAQNNHIDNVKFYASDLMADCSHHAWTQQKYDKILLDPPRSGALDILPLLASLKANTLLYVSCNPATLARDAGELVNKYGYTLLKAGIMDMFPHTGHVESIALFCKA